MPVTVHVMSRGCAVYGCPGEPAGGRVGVLGSEMKFCEHHTRVAVRIAAGLASVRPLARAPRSPR